MCDGLAAPTVHLRTCGIRVGVVDKGRSPRLVFGPQAPLEATPPLEVREGRTALASVETGQRPKLATRSQRVGGWRSLPALGRGGHAEPRAPWLQGFGPRSLAQATPGDKRPTLHTGGEGSSLCFAMGRTGTFIGVVYPRGAAKRQLSSV